MREINIDSPFRSFEHKEHFALLSANNPIFSSEGLIQKCVYHVVKYIDLKQLLMRISAFPCEWVVGSGQNHASHHGRMDYRIGEEWLQELVNPIVFLIAFWISFCLQGLQVIDTLWELPDSALINRYPAWAALPHRHKPNSFPPGLDFSWSWNLSGQGTRQPGQEQWNRAELLMNK